MKDRGFIIITNNLISDYQIRTGHPIYLHVMIFPMEEILFPQSKNRRTGCTTISNKAGVI
jgi:hypothetical protein